MDVQFLISRLKAELTGVPQIGGAAELDAALEGAVALPAVFVVPVLERGQEVDDNGPTTQALEQTYSVIQAVANRRDPKGQAALVDLGGLRSQVKRALVGWEPAARTGQPLLFESGRLLRMDGDGRLWWADEFSYTDYWSESE